MTALSFLARLPALPVVLRRTLVAEHALLEAKRRELHALGERLAAEIATVAVLKRQLSQEFEQRRDAERELGVQKARADRHFESAERRVREHNAALGLRDGAASDELPPRAEPTVRLTANGSRLRDVSQPAAAFVHPVRAGGASPAPAPVADHPPRPA